MASYGAGIIMTNKKKKKSTRAPLARQGAYSSLAETLLKGSKCISMLIFHLFHIA
jgi:hypothetical protein